MNGWINRRLSIAQRRLDYRLKALQSFLPVWFAIQRNDAPFTNPDFLPKLELARSEFQLYGLEDEIELIERFVKAIESEDLVGANQALGSLVPIVRNRIRNELKLNTKRHYKLGANNPTT